MGKPNSQREIRVRREKIMILMARGYTSPDEIARVLGTTMTVNRDMHYINEMTNRGLFDMAKESFATAYFNCIDGLDEILKQCWKIYHNPLKKPEINQWHKIAALKIAGDINLKKFSMFQEGPATMELSVLRRRVEELRRYALEDKTDTFTTRSDGLHSHSSSLPYHDFNVRDLDKP
jgi:hypothetical protein